MIVAETTSGRLRGSLEAGLAVFRGIPFAAPPVGELRWLTPQPHQPWGGVREALRYGNAAPQELSPLAPAILALEQEESEDCLYLNVWSPGADTAARPVMFWIHGGGFYMGAGSQRLYDGRHLARRDVVVVTINYRLGPFGFVHFAGPTGGAIPATGNEGFLDQIAALEWVRDNIERFGGDPGNVTIFGESAGGMSVASLLTMPTARGLFHKAAVHSGPGHTNFSLEEATRLVTEPLLEGLGSRDPERLRRASTKEAQAAMPSFWDAVAHPDVTKRNDWAKPVVDGELLTDWPEAVLRSGAHAGMPLMVGTTRDEMSSPPALGFEAAQLFDDVARLVPGADAHAFVEAYRAARSVRSAPVDAQSLSTAILTHRSMTVPSTRLLDAHRPHGPAYHFIFDWASPQMDGALGAEHGIDIGFVFGSHDANPDHVQYFGRGPAADALANAVMDAWAAFAHTGDPSGSALGDWPVYGDARETMLIGAAAEIREAPFEAERVVWDGVPTRAMR